jgi:hypothetical protein
MVPILGASRKPKILLNVVGERCDKLRRGGATEPVDLPLWRVRRLEDRNGDSLAIRDIVALDTRSGLIPQPDGFGP